MDNCEYPRPLGSVDDYQMLQRSNAWKHLLAILDVEDLSAQGALLNTPLPEGVLDLVSARCVIGFVAMLRAFPETAISRLREHKGFEENSLNVG